MKNPALNSLLRHCATRQSYHDVESYINDESKTPTINTVTFQLLKDILERKVKEQHKACPAIKCVLDVIRYIYDHKRVSSSVLEKLSSVCASTVNCLVNTLLEVCPAIQPNITSVFCGCVFEIVTVLCDRQPEMRNILVESVSDCFLALVTNKDVGFSNNVDALKTLNQVVEGSDRKLRIAVAEKCSSLLSELAKLLYTCGDYDMQISIIEALFRYTTKDHRKEGVKRWLPDLPDVQSSFISIKDFEPDCRKFLNIFNSSLGEDRLVFSYPCVSANFGGKEIKKPADAAYTEFWIDFNLGSGNVIVFCDGKSLRDDLGSIPNPSGKEMWETIVINRVFVTQVTLSETLLQDGQTLRLQELCILLSAPCHSFISGSQPCNLPHKSMKILFSLHIELQPLLIKMFPQQFQDILNSRQVLHDILQTLQGIRTPEKYLLISVIGFELVPSNTDTDTLVSISAATALNMKPSEILCSPRTKSKYKKASVAELVNDVVPEVVKKRKSSHARTGDKASEALTSILTRTSNASASFPKLISSKGSLLPEGTKASSTGPIKILGKGRGYKPLNVHVRTPDLKRLKSFQTDSHTTCISGPPEHETNMKQDQYNCAESVKDSIISADKVAAAKKPETTSSELYSSKLPEDKPNHHVVELREKPRVPMGQTTLQKTANDDQCRVDSESICFEGDRKNTMISHPSRNKSDETASTNADKESHKKVVEASNTEKGFERPQDNDSECDNNLPNYSLQCSTNNKSDDVSRNIINGAGKTNKHKMEVKEKNERNVNCAKEIQEYMPSSEKPRCGEHSTDQEVLNVPDESQRQEKGVDEIDSNDIIESSNKNITEQLSVKSKGLSLNSLSKPNAPKKFFTHKNDRQCGMEEIQDNLPQVNMPSTEKSNTPTPRKRKLFSTSNNSLMQVEHNANPQEEMGDSYDITQSYITERIKPPSKNSKCNETRKSISFSKPEMSSKDERIAVDNDVKHDVPKELNSTVNKQKKDFWKSRKSYTEISDASENVTNKKREVEVGETVNNGRSVYSDFESDDNKSEVSWLKQSKPKKPTPKRTYKRPRAKNPPRVTRNRQKKVNKSLFSEFNPSPVSVSDDSSEDEILFKSLQTQKRQCTKKKMHSDSSGCFPVEKTNKNVREKTNNKASYSSYADRIRRKHLASPEMKRNETDTSNDSDASWSCPLSERKKRVEPITRSLRSRNQSKASSKKESGQVNDNFPELIIKQRQDKLCKPMKEIHSAENTHSKTSSKKHNRKGTAQREERQESKMKALVDVSPIKVSNIPISPVVDLSKDVNIEVTEFQSMFDKEAEDLTLDFLQNDLNGKFDFDDEPIVLFSDEEEKKTDSQRNHTEQVFDDDIIENDFPDIDILIQQLDEPSNKEINMIDRWRNNIASITEQNIQSKEVAEKMRKSLETETVCNLPRPITPETVVTHSRAKTETTLSSVSSHQTSSNSVQTDKSCEALGNGSSISATYFNDTVEKQKISKSASSDRLLLKGAVDTKMKRRNNSITNIKKRHDNTDSNGSDEKAVQAPIQKVPTRKKRNANIVNLKKVHGDDDSNDDTDESALEATTCKDPSASRDKRGKKSYPQVHQAESSLLYIENKMKAVKSAKLMPKSSRCNESASEGNEEEWTSGLYVHNQEDFSFESHMVNLKIRSSGASPGGIPEILSETVKKKNQYLVNFGTEVLKLLAENFANKRIMFEEDRRKIVKKYLRKLENEIESAETELEKFSEIERRLLKCLRYLENTCSLTVDSNSNQSQRLQKIRTLSSSLMEELQSLETDQHKIVTTDRCHIKKQLMEIQRNILQEQQQQQIKRLQQHLHSLFL